tara:strand:+ start:492 stop:1415 length:924 start_codon:yes stop_codon:yes gene_type:complete
MAFIGNQPVEQYSSIAKQDITGNGGTTYTLNAVVTSPEDIEVFINHVRQEPTTSYGVSGTTLTFTEALASTDDCYVVYQGRTVGTRAPGDNTVGTGKIQANAVTSAKLDTNIAVSGNLDANVLRTSSIKHTNDTTAMTIASSGALAFGGATTNANQPCWRLSGYSGSTLVPAVNNTTPLTYEAITFSQGVTATTSRITIATPGKYMVGVRFVVGNPSPNTETRYMSVYCRVNGSSYPMTAMQGAEAISDGWGSGNSYHTFDVYDVLSLSANDYLEGVISRSSSSDWNGNIYGSAANGATVFFGYLIG